MMKIYLKIVFLLALIVTLSSCNSLFGITKLDHIDFATAQIRLTPPGGRNLINTLVAGGSYELTVTAYDSEEGKIRDLLLNKQVVVELNNSSIVDNSRLNTWDYSFKLTNNNLVLLEQGFLELTLKNLGNGSQQTVRYPTLIKPQNTLNLNVDHNGNGATTTLSVALLDTTLIGLQQGKILLVVDHSTQQGYTTTTNLLITANGAKGNDGLRGVNGHSYPHRRGSNGGNGGNGSNGGNGGTLTLNGSTEALKSISTQTNGGLGGRGGMGGLGGRGSFVVISMNEALRNHYDIEFMRPMPNQDMNSMSASDRNLLTENTRNADSQQWNPTPPIEEKPSHTPQNTHSFMVMVKYYDGLNGMSGMNGNNGLNGQTHRNETRLDFVRTFRNLSSNSQILENLY